MSSSTWLCFLWFIFPLSQHLFFLCWPWFFSNVKKRSSWLLPCGYHGLAMKFYVTPAQGARQHQSTTAVFQHQVILYSNVKFFAREVNLSNLHITCSNIYQTGIRSPGMFWVAGLEPDWIFFNNWIVGIVLSSGSIHRNKSLLPGRAYSESYLHHQGYHERHDIGKGLMQSPCVN